MQIGHTYTFTFTQTHMHEKNKCNKTLKTTLGVMAISSGTVTALYS